MNAHRYGILIACFAMGLILTITATAGEFVVNSTEDLVDSAVGNGVCAAANGPCTLRAAVQEANASAEADTIVLSAGTYVLTQPGQREDASATGDLDVSRDVTFRGDAATTTIVDGGAIDRILDVRSGVVRLERLSFRNGNAPAGNLGGAVHNLGTLHIDGCVFTNNIAAADGGAVGNESRVTGTAVFIANSVFTSNQGVSGGAISTYFSPIAVSLTHIENNRSVGDGGGIFNINAGTVIADRVTLVGNVAGGAGGAMCGNSSFRVVNTTMVRNVASRGGAMYLAGGSTALINNSTIVENTVVPGGDLGGILDDGGQSSATNTILALNSDGDCGGMALRRSPSNHNLTGESCQPPGIGNLVADPRLEALRDNGGAVATVALRSDSPAIDAGENSSCDPTSANGLARPQDGNGDGTPVCDIGAFELSAPSADLQVVNLGPESVSANQEIVYRVSVTNHGPSEATQVVLQLTIPPELTFVSNTGACVTPYPCALGTLRPDETRTIESRFRVAPSYDGPPLPVVVASVSSATPDPNAANNVATAVPRSRKRPVRNRG